jgi:hypothetical protein
MKTAGRGNPNRWTAKLSNRAHGAAGQNRSCAIKWAAKEENFQPRDKFFSLTFPFIDAGSNGRCNTIWYKAVFKGGVYETRKTVWTFSGAEVRRVATLEGGADAA